MNTGYKANAFPLVKGNLNLTSGTYTSGGTFLCVDDGQLTITWEDGTSTELLTTSGSAYAYVKGKSEIQSITINSGTFHRA